MMMIKQPTMSYPTPLYKRLFALCYDLLITLALILLTTILAVALNHGTIISPGNRVFQSALILIVSSYYIFSWVIIQQTIGMRAWGFRIQQLNGNKISYLQASSRWLLTILSCCTLGICFFRAFFSKEKQTSYDKWLKTEIINT